MLTSSGLSEEEMVTKHIYIVEQTVNRLWRGNHKEEKEDYYQYGCIALIEALEHRDWSKSYLEFIAYARTKIRYNILKSVKGNKTDQLTEYYDYPPEVPIQESEINIINDIVNALPDHLKEIIILHFFESLSLIQISRKLSLNVNTVYKRRNAALLELRKKMES